MDRFETHEGFDDSEEFKDTGWARNVRLIWTGSATSQLGTISAATASPLLALSLSDSPIYAGWVAAAATLPGVLLNIPAGFIADRRMNRKRLMVASQAIRIFSAAAMLIALYYSFYPQLVLVFASMVDSICAAFYNIAEITMIREMVPEDSLRSTMAKNEARHHIAILFGRPFGGFLFGLNQAFPYAFDALTSVFALATLSAVRKRDPAPPVAPLLDAGAADSPPFGWMTLRQDVFLRSVLSVCAVSNFLFQIVILLLVVKARDQHYLSLSIGFLLATSGVSGIFGAILAPRILHKRDPHRAVFWCFMFWIPLVALVAYSSSAAIGLVAWGLCSFLGAHINVALAVYQATNIPEAITGRVASLNKFITGGAVPLGALSAGYLIDGCGTQRTAVGVLATMTLVVSTAITLLRRSGHKTIPGIRDVLARHGRRTRNASPYS